MKQHFGYILLTNDQKTLGGGQFPQTTGKCLMAEVGNSDVRLMRRV